MKRVRFTIARSHGNARHLPVAMEILAGQQDRISPSYFDGTCLVKRNKMSCYKYFILAHVYLYRSMN